MKRNFRQRVTRVAVACAIAISGTMLENAPAHAASPSYYLYMYNSASHKCMSIGAGSKADGAGVIQWTCHNGVEQIWYLNGPWYPVGPSAPYYQIVNYNSHKCLSDPANNPYDGVQLIQYTCYGGDDQLWYMIGAGPVGFEKHNNYNQCIADGGANQNDGAPIIQWSCDGLDEQWWSLIGPVTP